jgi:hypothetical protein
MINYGIGGKNNMEKTGKRRKSRKERLARLAQALVRCAGPDVYFAQTEQLQQAGLPTFEPGGYVCIVPEQIFTLAKVENYNVLTNRPRI